MNQIDTYLLKKYIKIVLDIYHKERVGNSDRYNFRCNICGDSKKNSHKKRGWFLTYKNKYIFKCFNCGISKPAKYWLKEYYPEFYNQYIQEAMVLNNNDYTESKPKVKKHNKRINNKYKDFISNKK